MREFIISTLEWFIRLLRKRNDYEGFRIIIRNALERSSLRSMSQEIKTKDIEELADDLRDLILGECVHRDFRGTSLARAIRDHEAVAEDGPNPDIGPQSRVRTTPRSSRTGKAKVVQGAT